MSKQNQLFFTDEMHAQIFIFPEQSKSYTRRITIDEQKQGEQIKRSYKLGAGSSMRSMIKRNSHGR